MKCFIPLCALISALGTLSTFAILDENCNDLSDLWEKAYNGGDLFEEGFDLQDDPDKDGWTNEHEAAAGTNPFDPNAPEGIVRPQIAHIPDVLGVSLEAIAITWQTIPGKQYTLLYSPDLVEWFPVPDETFIGNGSEVGYNFTISQDEKIFWRVKIADVDSDGDLLTNSEEHDLGTDPFDSETITDIPDLWLAKYFYETLVNGGPTAIDLNADPDGDELTNLEEFQHGTNPNNPDTDGDYLMDGWEVDHEFDPTNPDENNNGILDGLDDDDGDGLTNAQEQAAGTDPAVEDGDDIGKEAIINGDFSEPIIGSTTPSNSSDSTWDYWSDVHGWKAVTGSNIELQNIESTGTNGQYAELKAHPEGHYGIYQEVATSDGTTYLLVLDCKSRSDTTPDNNKFSVKIDGLVVQHITPTSSWATQVVPFTATSLTKIELIPENGLDDTMGCLVDNVKLVRVDVTIKKKSDSTPPTDGVIAKVGDVIEFKISDSSQEDFPVSAQNIKWYQKQLAADGTYAEWQDIGQDARGAKFEHSYSEGGIFQIKCEITIGSQASASIYIRKKDNTMSRYDPDNAGETLQAEMKKGAPDAIGICDTQKQLDIRYHAKISLNSTYYDQKNNIYPVGAGYHCNIFVAHKAGDAGATVPWFNGTIYSYPPAANQWAGVPADAANGHPAYEFNFTNWPLLSSDSNPQPGMVAGKGNYSWSTGHCGIVDYDGQWISASGTKVHRHTGFVIGRNTDLSNNRLPAGKRKYTGS